MSTHKLPERVWGWIKLAEGGDANHPADRGGRTRFGIAERAHPEAWRNGPPAEDQARAIYLTEYWLALRCPEIEESRGLLLVDLAIQHGARVGVVLWQQILGCAADGKLGPVTLRHALEIGPTVLRDQYFTRRARHYLDIVQGNSTQAVFLSGWIGRLFRLQAYLIREYPA